MANNAFLKWFQGVPTKMTQNGKQQEEPKEEKQQSVGKPNPTTPIVRGPQAGIGYEQLAGKPRNPIVQEAPQPQQPQQPQPQQGYAAIMGNKVSGGNRPSTSNLGAMAMPEPPIQTLTTGVAQPANAATRQQTGNTALSIVDYLVSKGLDHSLGARKKMAEQYGIDTSNSYNMNVALLKRLQENEERKQIKYGDKQHMYQAQQLNASNPINLLAPQRSPEQNIKELIAQFKKGGCVKKKPKKCAEGDKVTKGACGTKVEKNKCGGKAKKKK